MVPVIVINKDKDGNNGVSHLNNDINELDKNNSYNGNDAEPGPEPGPEPSTITHDQKLTENNGSDRHVITGDVGSNSNERPNDGNSRKFLAFTFYKVDPKWRWLNEIGKDEAAREFLELLNVANTKMKVRTYSTIGLRSDCEFMIWTVSPSLENIQVFASKIYSTILGKYVEPTYTFLSMTRKSIYSNQTRPSFDTDDYPLKYVIVYPFIKSREWYLLPFEKRKRMMEEHIKIGRKYPGIRLNTTYSFGIGDQDFMLAFETLDMSKFQDLIMELRETQVSKYIVKDLPMIPCVLKSMDEIVKSLG
jgi:chlorite dismutase